VTKEKKKSEAANGQDDQMAKSEELLAKIAELEEAFKRERADFINYKRRTDEERVALMKMAKAEVALTFLPVYDSVARALEMTTAEEREGLEKIVRIFEEVLLTQGISKIDLSGGFNPEYCEAMGFAPGTPENNGQIAKVVETGFSLHGTVIRPAKVTIYKN
jgi:molecular chaperone GrpE